MACGRSPCWWWFFHQFGVPYVSGGHATTVFSRDARGDHLLVGCLLAVTLHAGLIPRFWARMCTTPCPTQHAARPGKEPSMTLPHPTVRLSLLLTILAATAQAKVYYVDVKGDDSHSGSAERPFRTLKRGAESAKAGDTVIVRDGIYGNENAVTGGDSDDNNHSSVILHNSGTPSAWITFKAAHKWAAVLDCQMTCDSYINLLNASYIIIEDFVITRGAKEGIHSNDSAHHIVLRGNRIEYIANRYSTSPYGMSGMYTNPNCHDFIIDGNVFHDIGRTNHGRLDHGLYLHGANFTVINNIFYNLERGWSIQAADGLSNVLIANNTFSFPEADGEDGQIMLWRTQTSVTIRNNIFYRPKGDPLVRYHSHLSDCAVDHNLVFGPSRMMADTSGCRVAQNRLGVDPRFVDPSTPPYNFHLLPKSPAVGSGIFLRAVAADFDGAKRSGDASDIGAYSFPR